MHRERKSKAKRSDLLRASKQYLWNVRKPTFIDHSRLNGIIALFKVYYVYHNHRNAKVEQINTRLDIPTKEVTSKQDTSFHDTTALEVCENNITTTRVKEDGNTARLEKDNNYISVAIEKI